MDRKIGQDTGRIDKKWLSNNQWLSKGGGKPGMEFPGFEVNA